MATIRAIAVRFHGPTEKRGSRYTASVNGIRVTVEADHALSPDKNRIEAARRLCEDRLGWSGVLIEAGLLDEKTHVIVHASCGIHDTYDALTGKLRVAELRLRPEFSPATHTA